MQGFKGEVEFSNQVPWRKKWYSPGIMGPFSFMPFMECYRGILSMDHSIKGSLTIDGEEIDFHNGRGYMEKDWGARFLLLISGCNPIILAKKEFPSKRQ